MRAKPCLVRNTDYLNVPLCRCVAQANSGNVEVLQGPPLTLNSFSLRLLTADERLYAAGAVDEQQPLR